MQGNIYLIRNLVNGKGYVGQTVCSIAARFAQHKCDSKGRSKSALHCAIRKYGSENFVIVKIVSCEISLMDEMESYFISSYNTFAPTGHGYNLNKGGFGLRGWKHSEESKRKISASQKGKKRQSPSLESRAKMALAKSGKKQSPEHIARAATASRGRKYVRSEEYRVKQSVARKQWWNAKKMMDTESTREVVN